MTYANIRELLPVVGRYVLDVTQHDEDEWLIAGEAYIMLHFDNGSTLRIVIEDDERVAVGPPATCSHRA